MIERIEIPEWASAVKASFPEKPDPDEVDIILEYVKRTGTPWLYPEHTHAAPPKDGSMPEFVWDYEVPDFGVKRLFIAPCPHCAPDTPKYKKGVIAYFADEHVIRLMGKDCFAAMNPEVHAESMRNMHAFKKSVKDERYLRAQLPKLDMVANAAAQCFGTAQALDRVQAEVASSFSTLALQIFYNATKGGEYRIRSEGVENITDENGNTRTVRRDVFTRYARAPSMEMFDPSAKAVAPRVKRVLDRLDGLRQQIAKEPNLNLVAAKARSDMVRAFGSSYQELKDLMVVIDNRRQILREANIATLRTWGARPDAETNVFVEMVGNYLRIGRESIGTNRIQCQSAVYSVLPALPALSGN